MNHLPIKLLGLPLFLAGVLAGCQRSQTDGTAATPTASPAPPATTTAAPTPAPEPTSAPEKAAAPAAIPDNADAIWQAIDQQSAELKTTIESGSLENVHHQAFAIRDLVAALPAHSPALPADEQTKLQKEVQFVATLADRLDETGDAGDRAGAQANYDKLVVVLNGITRTK